MKRLPTVLSTNSKSLPERGNSCVRVALDVPLPRLFDYAPPPGASVTSGDRVTVPLGRRNQTGVVIEEGASALAFERLKAVIDVRSDAPRLSAQCLALMHSGLQDIARTTAWLEAARGDAQIVLGTRLAVLAPLPKLGLIVVDEEHDSSFKQQEGLRYSARDAAVYRAKLSSCPIVLGTATPSLETWYNFRQGRYERIELSQRASPGARLPAVRTVDTRTHPAEQGFCAPLLEAIAQRLARHEQSLVFINRRGFAPVLTCEACGWYAGCERCTGR